MRNADELVGQYEPPSDGRPDNERRFCKAVLKGSNSLLMCHVNGFKTTYETLTSNQGKQLFSEPPLPPLRILAVDKRLSSFGDEAVIGFSDYFDTARAVRHAPLDSARVEG